MIDVAYSTPKEFLVFWKTPTKLPVLLDTYAINSFANRFTMPVDSEEFSETIAQDYISDPRVTSVAVIRVDDRVVEALNEYIWPTNPVNLDQMELWDTSLREEITFVSCNHEKGMTPFKGTNEAFWIICKHCGDELEEI